LTAPQLFALHTFDCPRVLHTRPVQQSPLTLQEAPAWWQDVDAQWLDTHEPLQHCEGPEQRPPFVMHALHCVKCPPSSPASSVAQ
jgi:hypothetical protein